MGSSTASGSSASLWSATRSAAQSCSPIAIDHPDRVGALVGVAAPSLTTDEQRGLLAERADAARRDGMQALAELHAAGGLPEGFAAAHPDDTAFYKSIIASGDPDGYAALCVVTGDLDLRADLGRIRVPTLLLEGELDRVVRPESVLATASAIPDCEYVELAGCGHIVRTRASRRPRRPRAPPRRAVDIARARVARLGGWVACQETTGRRFET